MTTEERARAVAEATVPIIGFKVGASAAEIEQGKRERDRLVDRATAIIREHLEQHAAERTTALREALVALATFVRSPGLESFGAFAHVHGFRPTAEQIAERDRVWALVDAALAAAAEDAT